MHVMHVFWKIGVVKHSFLIWRKNISLLKVFLFRQVQSKLFDKHISHGQGIRILRNDFQKDYKRIITSAIEPISSKSIIARTIVRSNGIYAICILVTFVCLVCAFVEIFNEIEQQLVKEIDELEVCEGRNTRIPIIFYRQRLEKKGFLTVSYSKHTFTHSSVPTEVFITGTCEVVTNPCAGCKIMAVVQLWVMTLVDSCKELNDFFFRNNDYNKYDNSIQKKEENLMVKNKQRAGGTVFIRELS